MVYMQLTTVTVIPKLSYRRGCGVSQAEGACGLDWPPNGSPKQSPSSPAPWTHETWSSYPAWEWHTCVQGERENVRERERTKKRERERAHAIGVLCAHVHAICTTTHATNMKFVSSYMHMYMYMYMYAHYACTLTGSSWGSPSGNLFCTSPMALRTLCLASDDRMSLGR